MTKYYCETCRAVFDEQDIIRGETISEDMWYSDLCPDCHSEQIDEAEDKHICPECEKYILDDYEDENGDRHCPCTKTSEVAELHPVFAGIVSSVLKI